MAINEYMDVSKKIEEYWQQLVIATHNKDLFKCKNNNRSP